MTIQNVCKLTFKLLHKIKIETRSFCYTRKDMDQNYCFKNKSIRILMTKKLLNNWIYCVWNLKDIRSTSTKKNGMHFQVFSNLFFILTQHLLKNLKTLRSHKTCLEIKLDIPYLYQFRFACENDRANFHQRKQYLKTKVSMSNLF